MDRVSYYCAQDRRFVIRGYNQAKPFASFLPGIAGVMGIPMWVFYVNRGQAIASFGVQDKNSPIMEYTPANKSYQLVPYTGFRTFIKIARGRDYDYYEPFSPLRRDVVREEWMVISPGELELEEIAPEQGLCVNVVYFTLPNESLAGLVRVTTIRNVSTAAMEVEVLDGLPAVLPYGVSHSALKEVSYLLQAWMGVFNLERGVPFYRLIAMAGDKPLVEGVQAGNFYLAFIQEGDDARLLNAIVDPAVVFGRNTALSYPDGFLQCSLEELQAARQITVNKTPCGFFGLARELRPGQEIIIYSVIGQVGGVDALNCHAARLASAEYLSTRRCEASAVIEGLTETVATRTSSDLFDAYCRQTFLDNALRGGYPVSLGDEEQPLVYHVYSRKHGDLERDYNFFSLAPEFYSQGNGNYRDVNQNRRDDVRINPQVKDFNILTFMNLIQPDGYNPLVILGSRFVLGQHKMPKVLALIEGEEHDGLARFLTQPFRPGQLVQYVLDHGIRLQVPIHEFLSAILKCAEPEVEATFGEGYWVDHWVYNLDLLESFLAIYPDEQNALLFERFDYTYFDSPARVLPRVDKYVLIEGKVRQVGAVVMDKEKESLIASRSQHPNLVRVDHGKGAVYRTNLFSKLLCLALVKFATLDPWGMGIEMEAEKPGWNDAMNGLPGLFGSSMCETYELRNLLNFMVQVLETSQSYACSVPLEVYHLLKNVEGHLDDFYASDNQDRDYIYWDRVAGEREAYREKVRLGFDGQTRELALPEVKRVLVKFLRKVDEGIARAREVNGGLYPTYFYYEAEEYKPIYDTQGRPKLNQAGLPNVRIKRFRLVTMPLFLEGFVKALKMRPGRPEAQAIYRQVQASPLFDRKLKMYKLNAPLDTQPHDIGRARAFTSGWLENESIWLHMEYKYLLEVLRAGLYAEFFEDLKNVLIPFQDPAVYGRSPLENSSFLVSSAHPDETLHGNGFMARLSGATAEFLSMWHLMMAGERPFFVDGGELCLAFRPILPGWMFDSEGCVAFRFLGRCTVTYHNPNRLDTFDEPVRVQRIILHSAEDEVEIPGSIVRAPYAGLVRAGKVSAIDVFLGR